MLRLHSLLSAVPLLMLAAEGGGGGGGTTLKDQLATAEAARDNEKARADKAETELKAEQGAHGTTKASLLAAEKQRDTEKARADKAEQDLKAEQDAHNELKAKDKSAGTKAAEQLARNGIKPAAKDTPENLNPDAGDPAALWEQYAKADSTEQAKLRAKHGDKLEAAALAYDKAVKEGR